MFRITQATWDRTRTSKAFDFAREMSAPDFVLDAFEGDMTKCVPGWQQQQGPGNFIRTQQLTWTDHPRPRSLRIFLRLAGMIADRHHLSFRIGEIHWNGTLPGSLRACPFLPSYFRGSWLLLSASDPMLDILQNSNMEPQIYGFFRVKTYDTPFSCIPHCFRRGGNPLVSTNTATIPMDFS